MINTLNSKIDFKSLQKKFEKLKLDSLSDKMHDKKYFISKDTEKTDKNELK